jgi:hypothetical protein
MIWSTRNVLPLIVFLMAPFFADLSHAQAAGLLTIEEVRAALNDALKGVQNAVQTAGGEARAVGNSLQGNVQNVIADIDAKFGNRLNTTIDKLDGEERQFMSDARELVFRVRDATKALAPIIGDEARRTIGEADIAAYNTSYSLPCRSQLPRLVYWLPTTQIAKGEEIVVEMHGNFLNFGSTAKALVDGKPAGRFTRSDRVISVVIPAPLVQHVTDKTSLAITLQGLQERVLEPRMMTWLFGCSDELKPAQDMSITVALIPRITYHVKGEIWANYKEWSDPFVYQAGTLDKRSDDCDTQQEVGFNICVSDPANMRAVRGDGAVTSKSGPSSWGPPALSGTTCVNFPAHLGGSGYDRFPFGVKNCKGSAWINANWSAWGQTHLIRETKHLAFDNTLPVGTYSFSLNASQAPTGDEWNWRYIVQVDQMRGTQIIQSESLSDSRLDNGGGWQSAMRQGVLTLTLPSNAD